MLGYTHVDFPKGDIHPEDEYNFADYSCTATSKDTKYLFSGIREKKCRLQTVK